MRGAPLDGPFPVRKPAPRLPADAYLGRRAVFFTVRVAADDIDLTRGDLPAQVAFALGHAAGRTGHVVDAWVVMPDHAHALVVGRHAKADAREWVRRFKERVGRHYRDATGRALWQRGYYDHVLRAEESVAPVCRYIFENPVRRRLCGDWVDWPWMGGRWHAMLLRERRENRGKPGD